MSQSHQLEQQCQQSFLTEDKQIQHLEINPLISQEQQQHIHHTQQQLQQSIQPSSEQAQLIQIFQEYEQQNIQQEIQPHNEIINQHALCVQPNEQPYQQDEPLIQLTQDQLKQLDDGYNEEYQPQLITTQQVNHMGVVGQNLDERTSIITTDYPKDQSLMITNRQSVDHALVVVDQDNLIQLQPSIAIGQDNQYENHNIKPQVQPQQLYSIYLQAMLNSPNPPEKQPSQQALQRIYKQLAKQIPQFQPQQIIALLYNNLIKIPREELIQQEADIYDDNLRYDGGRYQQQIKKIVNRVELGTFQIRKSIIQCYVTKGYGVKVYQDHMLKLNPNHQLIDKDRFKNHFVAIYKVIIKKVQEFIIKQADRQFEPMTKLEFHKTLGDVINCRKNFPSEFCETFFNILRATYSLECSSLPNQKQVVMFLKAILEKARKDTIVTFVKRLKQPEEDKDTDIWTQDFEKDFIILYIVNKNINIAREKLVEKHPDFSQLLGPETNQNLSQKINNALRVAMRWLIVENINLGNSIVFNPSELDRRYLLRDIESQIKLLKLYIKKPSDIKILTQVIEFFQQRLHQYYAKQKISTQARNESMINRQIQRIQQEKNLQSMIKNQIAKKLKVN